MTEQQDTITLKKSDLIKAMTELEHQHAWVDFVLWRLHEELGTIRIDVHNLIFDGELLKAKSELTDLLFPDNTFLSLFTDQCLEEWKAEFQKRIGKSASASAHQS